METRYVMLDLRDIQEALGSHWNPAMKDDYTGVCEACGEPVSQRVNECPVCGIPVVWRNSKIWKHLYGSPDTYGQLLSIVEPEEPAGAELCKLAGVSGFANQTEADRWRRAAGIARHAAGKKGRGRGAIAYAINLAEKIAREEPRPKAKPQPRPSGDEKDFMI
jgi:hypothetical protein